MKKYNLKDILIPIICCVVIFCLLIYIFTSIGSIIDTYNKVSTYSSNIDTYNDNIARLSEVSKTDLTNKMSAFDKKIPVGGDVARLVNDTINLAKSFGLDAQQDITKTTTPTPTPDPKNKNVTPTPAPIKAVEIQDLQSGDLEFIPEGILINGLVYPIHLSVSVKGTKENIMSFVASLSKQDRILNVQNVSLQKTPTQDTDNLWLGKIQLFAYTIAQQKADTRVNKTITDPLDPKLLEPIKKVDTNF